MDDRELTEPVVQMCLRIYDQNIFENTMRRNV